MPLQRRQLTSEEKKRVYKQRSNEVLVDFDGTLSTWAYPGMGEPTEGAREAMEELRRRGFRIVVWTSRMDRSIYPLFERIRTLRKLEQWLLKHQIPFDEIDLGQYGKRLAAFWIDDKVIHFCGDWNDVLTHARVLKEIEDERNDETDLDLRDRSGVRGDGNLPGGWEWERGGGCNDKGGD